MLNYLKGTLNRRLFYPYGGVPMVTNTQMLIGQEITHKAFNYRNLLFKLGECNGLIKLVSTYWSPLTIEAKYKAMGKATQKYCMDEIAFIVRDARFHILRE